MSLNNTAGSKICSPGESRGMNGRNKLCPILNAAAANSEKIPGLHSSEYSVHNIEVNFFFFFFFLNTQVFQYVPLKYRFGASKFRSYRFIAVCPSILGKNSL